MDYPMDNQDAYHGTHEVHLLDGGGRPGLRSDNFVEQIERGGGRIEETLEKLHFRQQSLFFLAAFGVMVAAVFAIFTSIIHFEPANFVNSVFLLGFGTVMLLLDVPGSPRWAGPHRRGVRKFARFLTRLTGKAVFLLYLGCMVVVCLWPRPRSSSTGLMLFLAIFMSFFVNIIALLGLFIALRKSLRLERVRKAVAAAYQGNWAEVYRKYAINDPNHGMQPEEFNRLASDYTQGEIYFDVGDLHTIYNALDEHQKSAVNEIEFGNWVGATDLGPAGTAAPCTGAMTHL